MCSRLPDAIRSRFGNPTTENDVSHQTDHLIRHIPTRPLTNGAYRRIDAKTQCYAQHQLRDLYSPPRENGLKLAPYCSEARPDGLSGAVQMPDTRGFGFCPECFEAGDQSAESRVILSDSAPRTHLSTALSPREYEMRSTDARKNRESQEDT